MLLLTSSRLMVSGIVRFNTPRACWSLASDYFSLSSPVYRRYAEEGARKHCVGYSCNISHDDVYRHPHGMNVEWKTNFQRGDAVHKYLLDHEVDYDDIYSYAKLERLLPGVEESLTCMSETINKSQMNEHHAADFRQLEDVSNSTSSRSNSWRRPGRLMLPVTLCLVTCWKGNLYSTTWSGFSMVSKEFFSPPNPH